MSESLTLPSDASREEKYRALIPQLKALLQAESDLVANMANTAAALHETFGFLWTGFYRLLDGELVLGPFQGPLACTRIPFGKGVCGAAVRDRRSIIVPDVEQFPGHIACSSMSRSEIVVPGFSDGEVAFVLDIDSERLSDFNTTDQQYLEQIVGLLTPTQG